MQSRRRLFTKHAWLFVLSAAFILHTTSFREGHKWGADYAWNWAQAVSLLNGDVARVAEIGAFRLKNMPDLIVGPAVYPWGYPVILAAGHALWGDNLLLMKLFMLTFYAGGWAVFYLLIRDRMQSITAALVLAMVAFGPAFFTEKDHLRSEAPFFLLFMLSAYLMTKARTPASLVLLGFVIFWAYWTRSHGVTLLGALFAYQILRQQFSVIPYLVFGLCWGLVTLIPGDTSYLGSGHLSGFFNEPIETVWRNTIYYLMTPGTFFDLWKPLKAPIGLLFYGLAAFGMWRRRREDLVLILVCLAYVSILVPYPFRQTRFLFPIMPMLIYFAFQGMPWHRVREPASIFLAVFCIATTAFFWVADRPSIEGPYSDEAQELFAFVRTTPIESVYLFWKPRSLTFYGSRRAVMRSDTDCPITHVVVYADPALQSLDKRNLKLASLSKGSPLFANEKFSVYKVNSSCG